jgi:hypothetical protein
MTDHVFGNRCLGQFDAELQKFSMDAWRSPARIGQAHFSDEIAQLGRNEGSALAMTTLPSPVVPKTFAMPCNYCLRFDNDECGSPTGPQLRKPNPQQTVKKFEVNATTSIGPVQD